MKNSPALQTPAEPLNPEIREQHQFAAMAHARNTPRAYLADWRHFFSWCKKRNKGPLQYLTNGGVTPITSCYTSLFY